MGISNPTLKATCDQCGDAAPEGEATRLFVVHGPPSWDAREYVQRLERELNWEFFDSEWHCSTCIETYSDKITGIGEI